MQDSGLVQCPHPAIHSLVEARDKLAKLATNEYQADAGRIQISCVHTVVRRHVHERACTLRPDHTPNVLEF